MGRAVIWLIRASTQQEPETLLTAVQAEVKRWRVLKKAVERDGESVAISEEDLQETISRLEEEVASALPHGVWNAAGHIMTGPLRRVICHCCSYITSPK